MALLPSMPWKLIEFVTVTRVRQSATLYAYHSLPCNQTSAFRYLFKFLIIGVWTGLRLLCIMKLRLLVFCWLLKVRCVEVLKLYQHFIKRVCTDVGFIVFSFIIWHPAIPNSFSLRVTLNWNSSKHFPNTIGYIIITYRNAANLSFPFLYCVTSLQYFILT